MKKLMFVAIAIMAGIAVADISSSNVVGYQNIVGENAGVGKSYIGATFLRVNGGNVTLGDISVNENFGPVSDTITMLNQYGGAAANYVYMDQDTADLYNSFGEPAFEFVPGWYDAEELDNWDMSSTLPSKSGVELYDGEALMLQCADPAAALVFAGQVADKIIELPCVGGGKSFLSNFSPVQIKFGAITVNENFGPVSDTITMLNQYGGAAANYVYMDQDTADLYNSFGEPAFEFVPGWYDAEELDNWDMSSTIPSKNDMTIEPGYGFMVQASAGASIFIPKAL